MNKDNRIIQAIFNSLVGDVWDIEIKRKWFQPYWIVRKGHTKYSVTKAIKFLKENAYIKYVTIGGGCDDYGDPCPPWNGYEVTKKGFEWCDACPVLED